MKKRLIIGLTLSAWCLYLASIFLPAADVSWNSATGIPKGGDLEQGWEVLQLCVIPFYWIAVSPFVYLIVNIVFLFSAGWFRQLLHGQKSRNYTVLASLSAILSWLAPAFVGDVGVGYFAWTAAITLVAVATYIQQ